MQEHLLNMEILKQKVFLQNIYAVTFVWTQEVRPPTLFTEAEKKKQAKDRN